jgi:hypothetical protein
MAQLSGITQGAGENSWVPAGLQQGSGQVAHHVRRAAPRKERKALQHCPHSHIRTIPQDKSARSLHAVAAEPSQKASSQVMPKITGTESNVATKIVSRAKITPRS